MIFSSISLSLNMVLGTSDILCETETTAQQVIGKPGDSDVMKVKEEVISEGWVVNSANYR